MWSPPSNLSSSNGLLGRCHPSACLLVVNVFRQQETVGEVTAPAARWFSRYGLEEVRITLKSYLPWHLRPVSIFPYKFIKVIGFKQYSITFTILSLCYPIFVLHYSFSSLCTALGSHQHHAFHKYGDLISSAVILSAPFSNLHFLHDVKLHSDKGLKPKKRHKYSECSSVKLWMLFDTYHSNKRYHRPSSWPTGSRAAMTAAEHFLLEQANITTVSSKCRNSCYPPINLRFQYDLTAAWRLSNMAGCLSCSFPFFSWQVNFSCSSHCVMGVQQIKRNCVENECNLF